MSTISITDDFQPLEEFGHEIQQVVLPIIAGHKGQFVPVGTGFVIAPQGLMMTATHVLQEAHSRCGGEEGGIDISSSGMELYALYVTNERHGPKNEQFVGGLWPIRKAWFGPELDIAFCWLETALRDGEPMSFPVARLSPGLPSVGEPILGFGYHKMESATDRWDAGRKNISYRQNTAFTEGHVLEVFATARDAAMLKFPVFRTEARFDPGMSGGPIFNQKGYICGVICSSLPPFCDDEQHVSYGSLIWPSMGSSVDVIVDEGNEPERLQIHTLVERGNIKVDGSFRDIRVQRQSDGTINISIQK